MKPYPSPARLLLAALVLATASCSGQFTCADDKTCVGHGVSGGSPGSAGAETGGQMGGSGGAAGGESPTGGTGGVPAPRLFVDSSHGSDSNVCSEAAPCRTLKHTLPLAKSGYFVELAPGEYGLTSGEDFSVSVPDGVTLESVTPASVTLLGNAARTKTALTFAGSATVRNLTIDSFARAIAASTGTVTLEEVTVTRCATGLGLQGEAKATVTNSSISDTGLGFSLADFARLSLSEATISGTGTGCGAAAGSVTGQAELELSNVTVSDNLGGLYLGGASTTNIADSAFSNNTIGGTDTSCAADYHIVMAEAPSLTLSNTVITGGLGGIAAAGEVTVNGGKIYAVLADGIDVSAGSTRIDGTDFGGGLDFGGFGLWVIGGAADVRNATFSQWSGGIRTESWASLRVRDTALTASQYGVVVTVYSPSSGNCDLGTAVAPGGNTIQGNTQGLYVYADGASLTSTWVIQAAGNTWNPSVQGTDASGHMQASLLSGPFTGAGSNFFVGSYNLVVQF